MDNLPHQGLRPAKIYESYYVTQTANQLDPLFSGRLIGLQFVVLTFIFSRPQLGLYFSTSLQLRK